MLRVCLQSTKKRSFDEEKRRKIAMEMNSVLPTINWRKVEYLRLCVCFRVFELDSFSIAKALYLC